LGYSGVKKFEPRFRHSLLLGRQLQGAKEFGGLCIHTRVGHHAVVSATIEASVLILGFGLHVLEGAAGNLELRVMRIHLLGVGLVETVAGSVRMVWAEGLLCATSGRGLEGLEALLILGVCTKGRLGLVVALGEESLDGQLASLNENGFTGDDLRIRIGGALDALIGRGQEHILAHDIAVLFGMLLAGVVCVCLNFGHVEIVIRRETF